MSATRDLIAAALTAAGSIRWQYPELADDMRELCARAMVQPDMGEVKNLVSAACNLMFDAGKLLGRRDAGADREVEDARSARTALLDYVRGVMAERDALIADNERLSGLYEQAVKGRADMRSALRDARAAAAAPQPGNAAEVQMPEPVAYLYTLEYGSTNADTKVSLRQLNYPFGVCGADYLARNDDGVSYVRQTPLYTAALRGEVKP